MPLPDAKPDRRIYELLKTTDLENLTFSDFQKVAQTIYAEQGAEDELRRIVLVNLARLSVAGEWTGLTSAGTSATTTYGRGSISGLALATTASTYGQADVSGASYSRVLSDYNTPAAFPIIAQTTGTVDSFTMRVFTAETGFACLFGFYTSVNGLPSALMGGGSISTDSTGYITQTSFSDSISLTAGETYWIVYGNDDNSVSTAAMRRLSTTFGFGVVETDSDEGDVSGYTHSGAATSLPSTFAPTAGRFFRPLAYYTVS